MLVFCLFIKQLNTVLEGALVFQYWFAMFCLFWSLVQGNLCDFGEMLSCAVHVCFECSDIIF